MRKSGFPSTFLNAVSPVEVGSYLLNDISRIHVFDHL